MRDTVDTPVDTTLPCVDATPGKVAFVLGSGFVVLLIAHATGMVLTYGLGHGIVYGLVDLFNIALEQNVPTLFSTLLLLLAAAMFFLLFRVDRSARGTPLTWLTLSLAFCFVGVDEFVSIHERLIVPLREAFHLSGYLYFAWVIPYVIAAAVLGCVVAPAIWRLGWSYRVRFGVSAVLYLGGAVVMEMLGGKVLSQHPDVVDLTYRMFTTAEEALEMLGVIVLIWTLTHLLRERIDGLTFRFS